jgi:hypothetical protein
MKLDFPEAANHERRKRVNQRSAQANPAIGCSAEILRELPQPTVLWSIAAKQPD